MCILSKRWRYLWIWVPVLDFDSRNSNSVATFSEFVNRALSLNKVAPLDKFSLQWSFHFCGYQSLNDWMDGAFRRGFQELDIEIVALPSEFFKLPEHFFTIKNLQVLKLSYEILVDVPDGLSVSFPSLKILHLNHSKYANDESFLWLLGGCIVLEEFVVNRSNSDDNVRNLIIYVPTLKALKLSIYRERDDRGQNELTIDAPNLEYLKIKDFSAGLVHWENVCACGSLVEANITSNVGGLFQLTKALCHTKFLSLRIVTLLGGSETASRMNVDPFPLFLNLTKLIFNGAFDRDVVSLLLENSPKLEVFVVELREPPVPRIIQPAEGLPKCLSPRLRKVYSRGFRGREPEIDMVECIIKNAGARELIEICSSPLMSLKATSSVLQKLLKSPRLSNTCQLTFY